MKTSVVLSAGLGLLNARFAAAAPIDTVEEGTSSVNIVGGTTVSSASTFPFIANLQQSGSFICGATILSTTKILTAAHCAVDGAASTFRVRVGSLTYASGGTVVQVASKIVHPSYNSGTVDYDVAVLTLATPLTFSSTIAAATLVASGAEPTTGQSTTVIGWGLTSENGAVSSTLRQVTVPVVDRTSCNSAYSGDITARMFCASTSGKDSCNGDSGGPIVDASTKVLLGGVSWGNGCARAAYPGVYADYANTALASWIRAQL